MKKQILISLTAFFAGLVIFTACTNTAEKAKLQEPATQTEVAAPVPKDTIAANAEPTTAKGEKGEKEESDEDEASEKKN